MSSVPKRLCIISSHADSKQIAELVKRLRPFEERDALELWHLASVPPGLRVQEHLRDFLSRADCILIWISPDLWDKNGVYTFLKQNASSFQSHVSVVPVLARHSISEGDDFLKSYESNLIPINRLPMPTDSAERRDAWLKHIANSIAARLGLVEIEQIKTQKNFSKIQSFWGNATPWEKFFALLGSVIGVAALIFGILSYLNDRGIYPSRQALSESAQKTNPINKPDACGFPFNFDSTHLYILITRFEDYATKNETECYGRGIESRIDVIKNRDNLPIKICYVDSLSPNQSDEAARARDLYRADLIIWGKLRDANANCKSEGFCLKFQPSDTLVHYAGGKITQKVDNEFQPNISAQDLEEGLINMGEESFDAWVLSMSNLKIGRKKPEFYRIASDWPVERQAKEYAIRANMFFQFGLYEKTIQDYDQAIVLKPTFDFYYKRGVTYAKLEQHRQAVKDFDMAAELEPNNANVFYNRGKSNRSLGRVQEGIGDYTKTVQLDSTYAIAYHNLGVAKQSIGQHTAAIADYDKAILLDPKNSLFYGNRGSVKKIIGQYTEAIADYDKAILLDPNIAAVYFNRGNAKQLLKQFAAAIEDFDKAILLDPKNSLFYSCRGSAKNELKQFAAAIEDFDKAILLDPKASDVSLGRGLAKINLDQYESAITDFNMAIHFEPNNESAYRLRGAARNELGQYKLAIADFDKAIQIAPRIFLSYVHRGISKTKLGQCDAALLDFDVAIKIEPNITIYNERGIAKCCLGRYKEGIADFNRTIQIDPNNIDAYRNISNTYWKQGEHTAAVSAFSKALRLQYLPGLRLHVAWILIIMGLLVLERFRRGKKTFAQIRKRVSGKSGTRQIRRQSERKKKK